MICLCGHPYLSHESGECTEKGCPCVKWEEVAEWPTVDERWASDPGATASLVWEGMWTWGNPPPPTLADPLKDITARQTNIVDDRFKKEWKS